MGRSLDYGTRYEHQIRSRHEYIRPLPRIHGSRRVAVYVQGSDIGVADDRWGSMSFTSWQFGIFAAVVFGLYYLPALRPFQVQLLVIASLFFYGYGQ